MLLVYGPRSTTYDFGPSHPLTPRRFGPSIELLRSVGAEPGLAPEPASDDELRWCHEASFLEIVKRFSADPFGPPEAGISEYGDVPPFPGMHEAAAMVAGGSIRAVEAILRGDVEHAHHPGGGLHHAMPARAAGFCIYDDPALAIARARRDGLRVLYVDLDVHHGDGVEAIHAADPGVLTVSFHESGRYLFPGTGFADEVGEGRAAGTIVNVPLEPSCGEGPWLEAVASLVPSLSATFGPDLIVSQHGADSHAWDPLAHLRVTTTAMAEAARIVDSAAHRFAGGRWLATGGGGYDAYRVVPRVWTLTWLAGAHREIPVETPVAWRDRWAAEAARYGQAPLPERFLDEPNAGIPVDAAQHAAEGRSRETAAVVRDAVVPALLRAAIERGWWAPSGAAAGARESSGPSGGGGPEIVARLDRAALGTLGLAPRVIPPASTDEARTLLEAALTTAPDADAVTVTAAVAGDVVVGLVVSAASRVDRGTREILALRVAPEHRRAGVATAMLDAHLGSVGDDVGWTASVSVGECDVVEPLPHAVRSSIGRRVLERAGFRIERARGRLGDVDASSFSAHRAAAGR
jgi:acetoin utilization protein AcuC